MTRQAHQKSTDANRDPITGAPGSHPAATGVGAALGGAAAGAAGGAIGGPIGAAVGAAAGAIAGGLMGKAAGEEIDPTAEEAYWREHYADRPYYSDELPFEDVSPAYQYGWESRSRYQDREFDVAESELRGGWDEAGHNARLDWDRARPAVRDAWDHAGREPQTLKTV